MKVKRISDSAFRAEFESEEELREEYRLNLSQGALRLATDHTAPLHATLLIMLLGPGGGEAHLRATVVGALPDGIALAIDGNPDEILQRLERDARSKRGDGEVEAPDQTRNAWDRIRLLSQIEKLLLAVKAERSERAILLQDNDPRVLLSLLRNPRLTVDEVARVAKSSFLTYQVADVILKASQWMSSLDVRLSLIHNPKTPSAFALRILPTLPESDVRAIARAGTNMALKQAALRRLQQK